MKTLQFIILIVTTVGFGQNEVKENFVLENSQVFWQKVLPRENIRADSLKVLFEPAVLPKIKHSKLDKSNIQSILANSIIQSD